MSQFIKAENLSINGIKDPGCWEWLPKNHKNKAAIAKLKEVVLFDIEAKVDTKSLVQKVGYTAYLIYDFERYTTGLDTAKASVRYSDKIGNRDEGYTINLQEKACGDNGVFPTRTDGRLEVELGQFHTSFWGPNQGEVEIRLFNTDNYVKKGILIRGIEIRPT